MNAKQAESYSGISKRNLRFYEQQGLIHPRRNPDNDYRDYSDKDITDLKYIRMLRMLDVPLEDISSFLNGHLTMSDLSSRQQQRLALKKQEIETALTFCRELNQENLSVDTMLQKMDAPENEDQLFFCWKRDYLLVEKAESLKSFTFTPDTPITNAREFTDALFAYANEHHLNLIITKEGMYPEFSIDGIDYYAERVYRNLTYMPFPVAMVFCSARNPELLEPAIPEAKRKSMAFFRNWWILLVTLLFNVFICIRLDAPFWAGLLITASEVALMAATVWSYRSNR